MIKGFFLSGLVLLMYSLSGQTIATTDYGRTVVLYEDGTFRIGDKAKTKEGDTVIVFDDGTFFRYNKSNKDKQHNAESTIIPNELRVEPMIGFEGDVQPPGIKTSFESDVQPITDPTWPENRIFESQPIQGRQGVQDAILRTDATGGGDDGPVTNVAVKAGFPGGESGFRDYVATEFQYPARCQDEGINGYVILRFIVDEGGRISRVSAIEETKSCPEFTQEAIRILKRSPRWIPGQNRGRFVNSWREIPIRLSVE